MCKSSQRTCRSHVSSSRGLDFFDRLKLIFLKNFVKIGDDLVEESETLDALVVGLELDVELGKVGDRREQDAHAVTLLVVELLKKSRMDRLLILIRLHDSFFQQNLF